MAARSRLTSAAACIEGISASKGPIMKHLAMLAIASLAAVFLPPALAQDNDAEKLFRGMEKKLLAAKAFEVKFDYQLEKRKAKGELLVTQENKVRLKVVGALENRKAAFELVADGKRL